MKISTEKMHPAYLYKEDAVKVIQKVRKKFIDHLLNDSVFKLKLSMTKVILYTNTTYEYVQGYNAKKGGGKEFEIGITVPRKDVLNEKALAFTFAHELAHMLFCRIDDCLGKNGRSRLADIPYDEIILPISFEEALCDYIAEYVISFLKYEDPDDKYSGFRTREYENAEREEIQKIERYFGQSLFDGLCIDDCDMDDDDKHFIINNALWYNVCTGNIRRLSLYFDKLLGKDAMDVYMKYFEEKFDIEQFIVHKETLFPYRFDKTTQAD